MTQALLERETLSAQEVDVLLGRVTVEEAVEPGTEVDVAEEIIEAPVAAEDVPENDAVKTENVAEDQ